MFSEFSLNEFLMNSFLNRIFRVALLFICQCSVFIICFTLSGATLLEYHKSVFPVKHFLKLFCFIIHFHVWNQNRLLSLYLFASATKFILTFHSIIVNDKIAFFLSSSIQPNHLFLQGKCTFSSSYCTNHAHIYLSFQNITIILLKW